MLKAGGVKHKNPAIGCVTAGIRKTGQNRRSSAPGLFLLPHKIGTEEIAEVFRYRPARERIGVDKKFTYAELPQKI